MHFANLAMSLANPPAPSYSMSSTALQIELPAGLIGLPQLRHFEVLHVGDSWPFVSLRSLDDDDFHFLAVEPHNVIPGYELELGDADADTLGLSDPDDALVYNIVTVHVSPSQYVTANLAGPVVVNRHTAVGKQVILANGDKYSTNHPLTGEVEPSVVA